MLLASASYIHTPFQYDYPFKEFVSNMSELCDFVYFVVTPPDDGTYEYLLEAQKTNNKIVLIKAEWGTSDGYTRLRHFYDLLIKKMKTDGIDWIFGLDTDEIIHENDFKFIRDLIDKNDSKVYKTYRYNFCGDFNHYLAPNPPPEHFVYDDYFYRLAPLRLINGLGPHDDFEGIADCDDFKDSLKLYHYSLMRDPKIELDKAITTQQWYVNSVDLRVTRQKETTGVFNPFDFVDKKYLNVFEGTHPKVMGQWIKDREHFWKGVV